MSKSFEFRKHDPLSQYKRLTAWGFPEVGYKTFVVLMHSVDLIEEAHYETEDFPFMESPEHGDFKAAYQDLCSLRKLKRAQPRWLWLEKLYKQHLEVEIAFGVEKDMSASELSTKILCKYDLTAAQKNYLFDYYRYKCAEILWLEKVNETVQSEPLSSSLHQSIEELLTAELHKRNGSIHAADSMLAKVVNKK